jgi:predicted O-methyltransferase YrrM
VVDERLSRARAVIRQRLEAGLSAVSIPVAEAEALESWVRQEDAMVTLEIGLAYGISALHVCAGLLENGHADARHVALDPNQSRRFSNEGLRALREAGLEGVLEFHAEDSQLALPRFVGEGRRFDLAFVDGNHRFDGVFVDLVYLGRLVRGGGVVFLDDYQLPAVAKAARFCVGNLGWTLEEEGVGDRRHHWAVLRLPEMPPERDFTYFVDF